MQWPDGSIHWITTLGRLHRNEYGVPQKMIGTIAEITDRKQIVQILQQHAGDLEERVRERTGDLQKANERLERMNRQLEEFAYAASHDLQEPLRKIITFIGFLKARESEHLTESGRVTFEKIVAASERMQSLINDLFVLSQVSNFNETFHEVTLQEVLQQVKEDLSLEIEQSGAVIHSENLPEVKGISRQLQQLFQNLISNSIKYARKGTAPVIHIAHESYVHDAHTIPELQHGALYDKIIFRDNGIGFCDEHADKIFQMFFRLHGKTEYPGTGIGLAICRKIAENHKGVIRARGEEGESAVFEVYLQH